MKPVPVNLSALEKAMAEPEDKVEYFLDTHTGEILSVNYAKMRAEDIAGVRLRVGADQAGRYVPIPRLDARVIVRDMDDFARTVTDLRVRRALERSLVGHRRLHNFATVLGHYTPQRIRWYEFKDARMRERVLKWMESIGIAPTE